MADLQNPFLRGLLTSQAAGERSTANQIGALSGLLSIDNAMRERGEQQALRGAVVMGPNGQLDAQGTLANLYRINPITGLKFQQALQKESQFGKVDPKDYTPESINRFSTTRNYGDLVPVRKAEFVNQGNVTTPVNPYTLQPMGMPFQIGISPNTQATLAQGQQQFNQTFPLQQQNAGINATRLFYDTGMGPMGVPGGNLLPPPMSPQSAPAPQAPIAPAGGWQIPPAEQARRDADARRIVRAEQTGGAGMIPTRNVIPDANIPQDPITQQVTTTRPLTPKQRAELAAKAPERTQSLRKEFGDVPEVKNYKTVIPIVESARKAPDTPAGDIDLIYAVGKTLDPGSVVREGELNLVIKSGSPAQRIAGYYNYIRGGGRLSQGQRSELTSMLDGRVAQLEQQYQNAVSLYTRAANAEGLPLDQIIGSVGTQPGAPLAAGGQGWGIKRLP